MRKILPNVEFPKRSILSQFEFQPRRGGISVATGFEPVV
jgi:hypothetical protein